MNIWMKLSALAMALILILSMIGCGKKEAAATESVGTASPSESGETTQTEEQPETAAPAGETEPTAATTTQEQPTGQETAAEQNEYEELDSELEDLDWLVDDLGTPPIVTVKWETYENMSDSEKAAYEACFTNQSAFDLWYEMAMISYEMEEIYDEGALNLKEILSMMLGKELE